jgi:hypothetical protein
MSGLGPRLRLYFPGAVDFQIVQAGRPTFAWYELLLQNIINVTAVAALFYAGTRAYKQRNLRFIDFLGFVSFSRIAATTFILFVCALLPFFPELLSDHPDAQSPFVFVMALSATIGLVWQMILIFSALREASGLLRGRIWTVYIIGLILAEALSYGLNFMILKH